MAGTSPAMTKLGRASSPRQRRPADALIDKTLRRHVLGAGGGCHQIWGLDLKTNIIGPFAGPGMRTFWMVPGRSAKFAQPSGLSSDGNFLYVADCEDCAGSRLPMDGDGHVETLVGRGLFEFGDRDGPGQLADVNERTSREAKLQHAVGVAYYNGKVYVADTYNSKIKTIDVKTGAVTTFLGGPHKEGEEPVFNEPTGLSIAGETLYVADTNAHRIRVVDLKTKQVKTLELKNVPPVVVPPVVDPKAKK